MKLKHDCSCRAKKLDLTFWWPSEKKNNWHTTPPQPHIAFIMPRPKSIGICHKSGTGKNQGRKLNTTRYNRWFNCNGSHSKSKDLSLPLISVSPPWNNSVINPSQISSVCQQSYSSSHFTPHDNQCFNIKYINSKRNEFPSPVIHVPPPLNDSVHNPPQLYYICQQSYRSSHKTTYDLQAYSRHGRTSSDPSNTMTPPSTNNGSRNIYGFMVDVSKLTPAQRQQHVVILLQHYHKLCNTNYPSSMIVSPPPILNIESLSQSTI